MTDPSNDHTPAPSSPATSPIEAAAAAAAKVANQGKA